MTVSYFKGSRAAEPIRKHHKEFDNATNCGKFNITIERNSKSLGIASQYSKF